jgi:hypothetical protein
LLFYELVFLFKVIVYKIKKVKEKKIFWSVSLPPIHNWLPSSNLHGESLLSRCPTHGDTPAKRGVVAWTLRQTCGVCSLGSRARLPRLGVGMDVVPSAKKKTRSPSMHTKRVPSLNPILATPLAVQPSRIPTQTKPRALPLPDVGRGLYAWSSS